MEASFIHALVGRLAAARIPDRSALAPIYGHLGRPSHVFLIPHSNISYLHFFQSLHTEKSNARYVRAVLQPSPHSMAASHCSLRCLQLVRHEAVQAQPLTAWACLKASRSRKHCCRFQHGCDALCTACAPLLSCVRGPYNLVGCIGVLPLREYCKDILTLKEIRIDSLKKYCR